jgi:hypothetical protein
MKSTRVPAITCPSCGAVLMVCTSQVGAINACPQCRQEISASVLPFTVSEFRKYLTDAIKQLDSGRPSQ